jgi:uncharacterized membrane protein YcaP (DUF421 family)
MELHKIALRVLFAYAFLLVLMRLSGKRLVSEAAARDFVLAIILGDMVDDVLWAEVGAAKFVAGTGALAVTALVVAMLAYGSDAAHRLIDGSPVPLLRDGSPVRRGMRTERVNENELASLLRHRGLERERWSEVERASLETEGELSVLRREEARPVQRDDRERAKREIARRRRAER